MQRIKRQRLGVEAWRAILAVIPQHQEAAARLEFEKAAIIRDQIDSLRSGKFKKLGNAPRGRPGRAASSGRR